MIFSIGYPVVSLGYDFKGYVVYQLRKRRQRKVQNMNAFYFQVLEEALPAGEYLDLINIQTFCLVLIQAQIT